jgi:hypothetical protein
MAKTYGMLPSQVAAHATTYDIMITDVYSTWEKHQMDKAAGRAPDTNDFDPEQLKQMLEAAKNGRRD